MNALRRFLASMRGRLFVLLLVGMTVAAVGATLLANARREQEFERQNLARVADRLQGYVTLLDANPELRERLLANGGPGIRRMPEDVRRGREDTALMEVLATRAGPVASAQVLGTSFRSCIPPPPDFLPDPGPPTAEQRRRHHARERDPIYTPPRCRLVSLTLSDKTPLRLVLETPAVARSKSSAFDPLFLGLLWLGIAVVAWVVARIASAPLRRLAAAAQALGRDLERDPLPLDGPLEVRRAAEAFNAMQQRIRRHLGERTQMLAAITHDLQTPLTRLRLRLENVTDEQLRERLIGDLAAMQALIREGLELARSASSSETRAALDLDSLLESVVADAADSGADARIEGGSGQVLMLRPLAMHRLFSNLVDNALKYGGDVVVHAQAQGGQVRVSIRDHGPGIAEDMLEAVFDPFVRLEASRSRQTGGSGLGLTIARTLALQDGARLELSNAPDGGLLAEVIWDAPPAAPSSPG